MRRPTSLGLALAIAMTGGAFSFAACVSNSNPTGGQLDAALDFDVMTPGFDAGPGTDGNPPVDSTLPPSPDAGDATTTTNDSGPGDSAPGDTGPGDTGPGDAGPSDTGTPEASYTDALAPSSWSVFDPASLDAGLASFAGATFDGRYAYFAPYESTGGLQGIVARLDTQQSYSSPGAWATFDTTSTLSGAGGFGGAVFDGRYVYFVPFSDNASTQIDRTDQTFVRYDTQGGFTAPASWVQMDGSGFVTGPFIGATFDGRYVYYASRWYAAVPIYDTTLPFTSPSAWSTFDTSTLSPPEPNTGISVFAGAIFDGKYVYFLGNIVARHDTTLPADAGAASWETYVPQKANDAGAFSGQFGGFDGRYLYVLSQSSDLVLRYDTQATFNVDTSWTTFDVATAGGGTGGYYGANFDGRYLYLAPNGAVVAIYDTLAPFNATTSWKTFDTTAVATVPVGYEYSVYDGQNLYMTSSTNSPILRLEVKTEPGPLPSLPQWHGSFL